mmetsp:Transcript_147340/g.257476  ORF Transcript_147340/g.257476 Transcript_147340/m.257476 type:complete len:202 (-) Transcript_147340:253-858(-)
MSLLAELKKSSLNDAIACKNCGKSGHRKTTCPTISCSRCKQTGHIRALCEPLQPELKGLTTHDLLKAGFHFKDIKIVKHFVRQDAQGQVPTTTADGVSLSGSPPTLQSVGAMRRPSRTTTSAAPYRRETSPELEGWVKHRSNRHNNRYYWHNPSTGESLWEDPRKKQERQRVVQAELAHVVLHQAGTTSGGAPIYNLDDSD